MFGHFASSHTVLKECRRTMSLTAMNSLPPACRARSHEGLRSGVAEGSVGGIAKELDGGVSKGPEGRGAVGLDDGVAKDSDGGVAEGAAAGRAGPAFTPSLMAVKPCAVVYFSPLRIGSDMRQFYPSSV
jgi:hypothetical protein